MALDDFVKDREKGTEPRIEYANQTIGNIDPNRYIYVPGVVKRDAKVEVIVFKRGASGYQFLMLKRVKEKGGFWQPVTGGIEEEDILNAAKREVQEETGLEDIKRWVIGFYHFDLVEKNKKILTEYVLGAEINENKTHNLTIGNNIYTEHDRFLWCSYKRAIKLLKWENNIEALKRLNKIMCNEI